MKRTENDLHFDKAELPMPKDCYDALMNAARSVKEEEPMKRASFRAVLIAAIILIATTAAAFAAQQLGWIEFLFKQYDIAAPQTAEEALNASQSVVCEVGPLTFTYKQLLTDKRTLLSAADVRTTDGTEALLVDDSNFYEAVDADSDVVLEKYQLASGTTWVEAAKQLNLPLYGVRALAESDQAADAGEAMEAAMWNEDGSIVYLNQSMLDKHTVEDELPVTLATLMGKVLMDKPILPGEGILHHAEGVDLLPGSIEMSGLEVSLVNAMSRESILKQVLAQAKKQYTHILIDCMPSLGMLTINALAASERVLIPVQAQYLPAKGLEQLLQTIAKVRRQINPKLQIDGILLTMVDIRTTYAREISTLLRETYGSKIKVFATSIPHSVRAAEISAEGKSIFAHDPKGKVATAYHALTQEVMRLEKQREKHQAELSR